MVDRYPHLAEPIELGGLHLKNRIMKNGTGFFWDDPETGGFMNDRYLDYFEALAKGGTALISTATGPLIRDVTAKMPGFKIVADEYIPGWRRWADVVHRNGAVAFARSSTSARWRRCSSPVPPRASASAIPRRCRRGRASVASRRSRSPRSRTSSTCSPGAAERTKGAGMDGTELNGACNHFLNNFLSRAWNKREDEYGPQTVREPDPRLRAGHQGDQAPQRRRLAADHRLLNGMEVDLEDGITIEESKEFARIFVEAGRRRPRGARRVLHVGRRRGPSGEPALPGRVLLPGPHRVRSTRTSTPTAGRGGEHPDGGEIKKVVAVPVITVGKLDWDIGEKAIADGKIDIISMNRRLFADPELPRKVLEAAEDVNPCISCMTCFDACEHFQPVKCRVNASLGREREYAITPGAAQEEGHRHRRRTGGDRGGAGRRAAATRCVLYEKQRKLGGSLPVAALVKGPREDLLGLSPTSTARSAQAGVEVHPGKAADRRRLPEPSSRRHPGRRRRPARGPDIPGIDGPNVLTARAAPPGQGAPAVRPGARRCARCSPCRWRAD